MSGKTRRLNRLFRHGDGRAVLMPIDHGLWYGPMPGIESPSEITGKLVHYSDGLLIAPGFARHINSLLPSDRALVVRVGTATGLSPVQDYESVFAGIETALCLDGDAIVHTLYIGGPHDEHAITDLGRLIEAACRYDMPVVAEFLPARGTPTWQEVAQWARLGFELGADVIKTVYTGDPEGFRHVTGGCPLPILIAGGPAAGTPADLVLTVHGAMEANAAGLAIGRRIWQSEDPAGLLSLLAGVVHQEVSLEQALSQSAGLQSVQSGSAA